MRDMKTVQPTILLIAVLLVLGGGVYWYATQRTSSDKPVVGSLSIDLATTSQNTIPGWKTYRNDRYGFEFQYPDDGHLETAETATLSGLVKATFARNHFTYLFNVGVVEQSFDEYEKYLTEVGFVLLKKDISLNSYPARELYFTALESGVNIIILVRHASRTYVLTLMDWDDVGVVDTVNQQLLSAFRFTD
jgi:hypothetical protein